MKRYCPMPSGTEDMLNALTNVRFWRQSGHDANGPSCPLMTGDFSQARFQDLNEEGH